MNDRNMKHISQTIPSSFMDNAKIRALLEEPFAQEQIKYRPGSFGNTLAYIEGHEVIKRLNIAFQGNWSFEIVSHEVMDEEVLVVGKLVAGVNIIKMAFGSSSITRNSETNKVLCIGDDLKSAATDALKKASSFLGVGLHLYDNGKDNTSKKSPVNGNGNGNGGINASPPQSDSGNGNGNGNGIKNEITRLTARQLAAIYAIAKSKGMDKDDIQRASIQGFDRMPDFLSKSQASNFIQALQQGDHSINL